MTKTTNKIENQNTNNLIDILRQNDIDPFGLNKELNKPFVKRMSFKERCEHINRQKFVYGTVRCTPKLTLKKLGISFKRVLVNSLSNNCSYL